MEISNVSCNDYPERFCLVHCFSFIVASNNNLHVSVACSPIKAKFHPR